jgi:prepilin-type N-terminal cleavage/methylation domain-containing protein
MKREQRCSGFTLVEMAIVMVIVGLMLGGLMMSLATTRENTRRSDAQRQLEEIVEALYGFAQAREYLPCPATPTSGGAEDQIPGIPGECRQQHGFVPAASLGLPGAVNVDGLLIDPWNSPYRYSVTNANSWAFTTARGMQDTEMDSLAPDLMVCREAACTSPPISRVIPAVVFSTGKNWAISTSADEAENTDSDAVFVVAGYSEANFDDLLTWLSPNILYTRMIAAGRLP